MTYTGAHPDSTGAGETAAFPTTEITMEYYNGGTFPQFL